MSNNMNIHQTEVELASARIKNSVIVSDLLGNRDERSTINANTNSKITYSDATSATEVLEKALETEADRIKELGNKFQEFDTLMNAFNTNL